MKSKEVGGEKETNLLRNNTSPRGNLIRAGRETKDNVKCYREVNLNSIQTRRPARDDSKECARKGLKFLLGLQVPIGPTSPTLWIP